jgi:hypothetical protein
MTTITPLSSTQLLTPATLRALSARRAQAEAAEPVTGLTHAQAARLSVANWKTAFVRTTESLHDLIRSTEGRDDGTEIAAGLIQRVLNLQAYGTELFAGADRDPRGAFRTLGRQCLDILWGSIHSTILAALEEAEPILRAEYQTQVDAALAQVDAANADTTAERRRADGLARQLQTQAATLQAEAERAAVGPARQLATLETEARAIRARLLALEAECAVLRTERDTLQAELTASRGSLLGLVAPPAPVSVQPVAYDCPGVLQAMALRLALTAQGHPATLSGRTVQATLPAGALDAALATLAAEADLQGYVRRAVGLGRAA